MVFTINHVREMMLLKFIKIPLGFQISLNSIRVKKNLEA